MATYNPHLPKIWLAQALIENLHNNLELLKQLTPVPREEVNTDKLTTLDEQTNIEEKYLQIMGERTYSQGVNKKREERGKLNEVLNSLHGLDHKLKLCPTEGKKRLAKLARKTRNERMQVHDTILKTISDLEEMGECQRINHMITENNEQTVDYNRTTQELDELKAELNRLTETIESTKVKKEKELSISQTKLAQAKTDLQKTTHKFNIEQPVNFANRDAKLNTLRREYHQEENELQKVLNNLLLHKDQQTKAHQLKMKFLKTKIAKINKMLERAKHKTETDLPEMRQLLEKTTQQYEEMSKKLADCVAQYKFEIKWKKDRAESIINEKRLKILRSRSCLTIQRHVRGFLVRLKIRREKESKKKKKKGKGKNKKKKK